MTYTANGQQILRSGAHFADTASPEIARALVLVLNHGDIEFDHGVPDDDVEFVERVLWGMTHG